MRDADVVLVSVPNPVATRYAALGPSGVLAACRAGTLIIDTSTIDPTRACQVASEAATTTSLLITTKMPCRSHWRSTCTSS